MFSKNLSGSFKQSFFFGQKRNLLTLSAINGSYSSFLNKKDAQQLSPLNGAIFASAKINEKLYELADIGFANGTPTATDKLIKSIFHRLNDTDVLRPTHNKSLPAYALSPVVTALILFHLKMGTLDSNKVRQFISALWKKDYIEMTGSKKLTNSQINNLLDLISQSKSECNNQIYPSSLTEKILLDFFYRKSCTKDDVNKFMNALQESGINIDTAMLNIQNEDKHTPDTQLSEELSLNQYNEACKKFLDEHYEEFFTWMLTNLSRLPQVIQSSYPYKENETRPNCVETVFHNLCNILLYNQETGKFDFSLLPDNLKLKPELLEIYKGQTDISKVNAKQISQAFMNLVSDRDDFIYLSSNYELDSRTENFIPVMNFLFGSTAETLDQLSEQFSTENRTVNFHQITDEDYRIDIEILNLYYENSINGKILVQAEFPAGHASISSNIFDPTVNKKVQEISQNLEQYALSSLIQDPLLFILFASTAKFNIKDIFFENPNKDLAAKEYADNYKELLNHIIIGSNLDAPINHLFSKNYAYILLEKLYKNINENPIFLNYIKYIIKKEKYLTFIAVATGNADLLDMILQHGSDPNQTDEFFKRPIDYATDPDIVLQLVKAGADVRNIISIAEKIHSNPSIVIKLVKETDYKLDTNEDLLHEICSSSQIPDREFLTLLEFLISEGFDPNKQKWDNHTPLHSLFIYQKRPAPIMIESARILLNAGADLTMKSRCGETVFHVACKSSHTPDPETIMHLLSAGADPNAIDGDGRTALDCLKDRQDSYTRFYSSGFFKKDFAMIHKVENIIEILENASSPKQSVTL